MTRSHKYGDRDYSDEAEPQTILPKFFAKSGFVDQDPKKVKKEGGGKGNWGRPTDELDDVSYNPTKPRRRSNSVSFSSTRDFKSKFEEIEHEPVFEDHLAEMEALPEYSEELDADASDMKMERQSTSGSDGSNVSVDGDRI